MGSVLKPLISCCLFGVAATAFAVSVQGAPVVIHDAGGTTPITTYRSALQGDTPTTRSTRRGTETPTLPRRRGVQTSRTRLSRSALGVSEATSAARITPTVEHPNAVRPVFIIDAAPTSLAWLTRHREALIAMGATGGLVGSVSQQQRLVLAKAARGLTLIPSEFERVARIYGTVAYPVLITAPGAAP